VLSLNFIELLENPVNLTKVPLLCHRNIGQSAGASARYNVILFLWCIPGYTDSRSL
jgi:hypothetical protein